MNYRHAYHAGNFADVHKHAVLALVLAHLSAKVTPFRVVDTHAGIGRYDLAAVEAEKTGEWTAGIGRLLGEDSAPIPDEITPLLAAYLDAVRAENADGVLRWRGKEVPLCCRRDRNVEKNQGSVRKRNRSGYIERIARDRDEVRPVDQARVFEPRFVDFPK